MRLPSKGCVFMLLECNLELKEIQRGARVRSMEVNGSDGNDFVSPQRPGKGD
mgnify:CR=1 FL=1